MSDALAQFHLLRPVWLMALLPLVAALAWLAREKPGLRRWQNIVDAHLAPHVLTGVGGAARRYPIALLGIAGLLAVVSLAGPAWKQLPQPVFASEDGLVIALDLSRSMDTQDVAPSRLARARFKITDILSRREEGQTALLVYAADAYTVSPLTDDVDTILSQLPAVQPALMPAQGSRADRALARAAQLLEQAGQQSGDVLLITDGVDEKRTAESASELAARGYRVSVLGVGTADGGPIPGEGGFVKRRDGSIVVTSLDSAALAEVARSGGGVYQQVTPDLSDVERLTAVLQSRQPAAVGDRDLQADVWREEGPWLLPPLLLLAALAFRRGVLAAIACLALLPPVPAHAFEWADLWSRPDQRAERALEAGEAQRAAELFRDPAWRAAASYRAGDYETALEDLEGLEGQAYNRGNVLARMGNFPEAIAEYERVLEQDPENEDARYNRDLLRDLLEQQEQQEQQQGESGEQQDSQQQGQQGEDQQQQAGGDQEQQQQADGQQGDQQQDAGEQQAGQDERNGESEQTGQQQAEAQEGEAGEDEQEDERQVQQEDGEEGEGDPASALAASDEPLDEGEQAVEQWLRRIPDDPGGLLRRKFQYQYQRERTSQEEREQW